MNVLILAYRNSWAQTATEMLRKIDGRLAVYSSYELPEVEYLKVIWDYVLYISSSRTSRFSELHRNGKI